MTEEKQSKKLKIWLGNWNVSDVRAHSNWLFIFGDNDDARGMGGQAIIRKCKNAAGVPTKRSPGYSPSDYYTDDDYEEHCDSIRTAFDRITARAPEYTKVVFPSGGLGTGLAELDKRAPRVMQFLIEQLTRLRAL
jgi:hypothetical protein